MTMRQKTVVVTGASQGIVAAIANLFLERGYNVVANSPNISRTTNAPTGSPWWMVISQPGDGVRAAGYSRKRRGTRRCGYAPAQGRSERLPAHPVTAWADSSRPRHRGGCFLSD